MLVRSTHNAEPACASAMRVGVSVNILTRYLQSSWLTEKVLINKDNCVNFICLDLHYIKTELYRIKISFVNDDQFFLF